MHGEVISGVHEDLQLMFGDRILLGCLLLQHSSDAKEEPGTAHTACQNHHAHRVILACLFTQIADGVLTGG